MENKSLRILAIFIIVGFVFIVNFAFFGVQGKITQSWTDKFTKEINHLEYKVDSLEKAEIEMQTKIGVAEALSKLELPKIVMAGGNTSNGNAAMDAMGLKMVSDLVDKMSN